jgi:hypothetical protein
MAHQYLPASGICLPGLLRPPKLACLAPALPCAATAQLCIINDVAVLLYAGAVHLAPTQARLIRGRRCGRPTIPPRRRTSSAATAATVATRASPASCPADTAAGNIWPSTAHSRGDQCHSLVEHRKAIGVTPSNLFVLTQSLIAN